MRTRNEFFRIRKNTSCIKITFNQYDKLMANAGPMIPISALNTRAQQKRYMETQRGKWTKQHWKDQTLSLEVANQRLKYSIWKQVRNEANRVFASDMGDWRVLAYKDKKLVCEHPWKGYRETDQNQGNDGTVSVSPQLLILLCSVSLPG